MTALILILTVLLALSPGRCRWLRRKLAQRDQRIAVIEASWTTLSTKYHQLKAEGHHEKLPSRIPTNEQIERGVW